MLRIFVSLSAILLSGCVHAAQASAREEAVCENLQSAALNFTQLTVSIYPDRHGDYLRIENCPKRTFAVDFSKSGLYTDQYAALLKQMRFNSLHGGTPIKMTISGSYRIVEKDGASLSEIIVVRIIDYEQVQ
ncbi:hypothetical protein ACFOWX_00085 [Sphingorhabdus arenilitoris]|uniref:Uncharacterized protein n=1 Tax=Sphingorhabdus arenilitoris TaxID=1490041 RepID=A0ABV8RC06_9SPHN